MTMGSPTSAQSRQHYWRQKTPKAAAHSQNITNTAFSCALWASYSAMMLLSQASSVRVASPRRQRKWQEQDFT